MSVAVATSKLLRKVFPKEAEEDLLAKVQRLRTDNTYLRNLQAFVLEEERQLIKK